MLRRILLAGASIAAIAVPAVMASPASAATGIAAQSSVCHLQGGGNVQGRTLNMIAWMANQCQTLSAHQQITVQAQIVNYPMSHWYAITQKTCPHGFASCAIGATANVPGGHYYRYTAVAMQIADRGYFFSGTPNPGCVYESSDHTQMSCSVSTPPFYVP